MTDETGPIPGFSDVPYEISELLFRRLVWMAGGSAFLVDGQTTLDAPLERVKDEATQFDHDRLRWNGGPGWYYESPTDGTTVGPYPTEAEATSDLNTEHATLPGGD